MVFLLVMLLCVFMLAVVNVVVWMRTMCPMSKDTLMKICKLEAKMFERMENSGRF